MMSTGWLGVLQSCVSLRRLLLYCHDTTTVLSRATQKLDYTSLRESNTITTATTQILLFLISLYFTLGLFPCSKSAASPASESVAASLSTLILPPDEYSVDQRGYGLLAQSMLAEGGLQVA